MLFKESVKINDLLSSAEETLKATRIPEYLQRITLESMAKKKLTQSRLKLIYNYKTAFAHIASKT